ncbi:MAG: hypothetical protein OMM_05000 [Candidatus Magnetoglobus multicellularis str. Araruama]|uniref:Transposase IS4-like domain-containing protein n=1 Tax=Candidatus Magnetoglobus multicellularis str. Araruama TaxID=890399 RepID=A0A1V1NYK2_9BACT|nr:MAG: hypothetical protein OMM_05000 [Candidatus Magnetoglobus multicellularis str. Araruama]
MVDILSMILSKEATNYISSLNSRVNQILIQTGKLLYPIENDELLNQYECLRHIWVDEVPVKDGCIKFNIPRSSYYKFEKVFVDFGLPGLLFLPHIPKQFPDLEQLVILIKKARPSLSYTSILRITQAVPLTREYTTLSLISSILQSYGYGLSSMKSDIDFWNNVQRRLKTWLRLSKKKIKGRDLSDRKGTFLLKEDKSQRQLELIRHLFYNPDEKIKTACKKFDIPQTTYYRLISDYQFLGPWAIIPACSDGREGISDRLKLDVILEKLKNPQYTPETIIKKFKLDISRYAIHRIFEKWCISNKNREPLALDEFMVKDFDSKTEIFQPVKTAFQVITEKQLLSTRRINRHFERICKKITIRPLNICDPGPLILAPFVNDFGIVQAFELYGPPKLRGKELTNIALLNVFRILAGYRRISHLSNNRDHSVAFASGIGMYGTTSKYYDDTIHFKFDQLYRLRSDLVARAIELGLIEGMKIGFDFHFKQFYGKQGREKNIGKGPDKSGDLVPGFRPHIVWDLAANVIINMAYYQGSTRAPRILEQFCEQNVFPLINPEAIKEIYMDSEYTKEGHFKYFKQIKCSNGDIYMCLKKNKQIKKLIEPALKDESGWEKHDKKDESKLIHTQLPHSKIHLALVILRDREKKDNIRCFGTTNMNLGKNEILERYRYRWVIENGIKDLVSSYFLDEIYGLDPEKNEFEFYCVMLARLVYEYFLRELGGEYLNNTNGDKSSLQRMRNLLFEKRNCTIGINGDNDFVLTNIDGNEKSKIETDVIKMLLRLKEKGKTKCYGGINGGL